MLRSIRHRLSRTTAALKSPQARSGRPAAEPLEPRHLLSVVGFTFANQSVGGGFTETEAVGDFNNDGASDIAAVQSDAHAISILLSRGDGTFAPPQPFPTGTLEPMAAHVVDMNADGKVDLLIAGLNSAAAAVMRGNGDGTFQAAQIIPIGLSGTNPYDIAPGDFNGDGVLDFATANGNGSITVVLATAVGTYTVKGSPRVTGTAPELQGVTAGDFTGDGKVDLAVANVGTNGTIVLFTGNGDGTFTQKRVEAGWNVAITSADLNGDGRPELIGGSNVAVTVLVNRGGGAFDAPMSYSAPSAAYWLRTGDFDGDGHADVVSYNPAAGPASNLFLNTGDGTLVRTAPLGQLDLQTRPGDVGDFNHDGLSDIAFPGMTVISRPLVAFEGLPQFTSYKLRDATIAKFSYNLTPKLPASAFTAQVQWTEGGPKTTATIVPDGDDGRTFRVVASNLYLHNGGYLISVTINDTAGHSELFQQNVQVNDVPPLRTISEFNINEHQPSNLPNNWPDRIVRGPGNDLWFAHNPDYQQRRTSSSIGRMTPSGQYTLYPLPAATQFLTSDAEGDAWFVMAPGQVTQLNSAGAISQYALPSTPAWTMAPGPDDTIWFPFAVDDQATSDANVNRLGRVTQDGVVTVVPLDRQIGRVSGMVYGPDGNFWLTELTKHKVARVTPDGHVSEFDTGGDEGPNAIAVGPNGNLWFVGQFAYQVGRLTPAGDLTLFPVGGDVVDITAGPDGAMWMVGYNSSNVARLTTSGTYEDYRLPSAFNSYPGRNQAGSVWPTNVATSADGKVWFSEQGANNVARVNFNEVIRADLTPPPEPRKAKPFSGTVARFTAPGTEQYEADIVWGDQTTPGEVVSTGDGQFVVNGTHTYAQEGLFNFMVTIRPVENVPERSLTARTRVLVDYPLERRGNASANNFVAAERLPSGSVRLMSFFDTDVDGVFGPFAATVDWGDGTTSDGTVVPAPGAPAGTFDVFGAHTYDLEGTYTVKVKARDTAGASEVADQLQATVVEGLRFQGPVTYGAATDYTYTFTTGDFTGDGRPDVLAGRPDVNRPLALLPNLGNGVLGAARDIALPPGTHAWLAKGLDVDHDGDLDLAVVAGTTAGANPPPPRLYLYRNRGGGTFDAPTDLLGTTVAELASADFNKDGSADLLTTGVSGAALPADRAQVTFGNADGSTRTQQLDPGAAIRGVLTGDFNGDGNPDVATEGLSPVGNFLQAAVFLGRGDGTFADPAKVNYPAGASPLDAADLTGDGRTDLFASAPGRNEIWVATASPTGAFDAGVVSRLDPREVAGASVGLQYAGDADVNGDGRADLVFNNNQAVEVMLGRGNGTFMPAAQVAALPVSAPQVAPGRRVVVADLNGDDRPDLVAGQQPQSALYVALATPYAATGTASALHMIEGSLARDLDVAFLTHEDPPIRSPMRLSATIDWGDGRTLPGSFLPNSSGGMRVVGTHAYTRPGNYTVTTTFALPFGLREAVTSQMVVANAPFSVAPQNFNAFANVPLTAALAAVTDPNPFSQASDFTALITWDDGRTSPGVLRPDGPGRYLVYGTNTYPNAGALNVRVTVNDSAAGSLPLNVTGRATVAALTAARGVIAGNVFDDANGDGIRQFAERGVGNVVVYVDANRNGTLDAGERLALTSAGGDYSIPDLPAGPLTVRQVLRPGYAQSYPAAAGDGLDLTLVAGQYVAGRDLGAKKLPPQVVGRSLFYNRSAFDGANPLPTAQDDGAIATDKTALLPGQQGGFANLSAYGRGINGLMVDVLNLGAAVTAGDFEFKVGNSDQPAAWAAGPAPDLIAVRRGGGTGGSDRVTLVWPDGAIRNCWLQVTVKATANTGLSSPDVFYFGSLVGEVGDSVGAPAVTTKDVIEVRRMTSRSAAPVTSRFDINRDGRVNAEDVAVVLAAVAHPATVHAIRPPTPAPQGAASGELTAIRRRQPITRSLLSDTDRG